MIPLDAESIWGPQGLNEEEVGDEEPQISRLQFNFAGFAGIYGASLGCQFGSVALKYGRQNFMALFVALAIVGLIIQASAYKNIVAIIVGRTFYGIAAGVFFVMAPKIIQENTLPEDFNKIWTPIINISQTILRLFSVLLLNGEISKKIWLAFTIIPIFLLVISYIILVYYSDYASIFFHYNEVNEEEQKLEEQKEEEEEKSQQSYKVTTFGQKRQESYNIIKKNEEGMIHVIKHLIPGGSDEMYEKLKDQVKINKPHQGFITQSILDENKIAHTYPFSTKWSECIEKVSKTLKKCKKMFKTMGEDEKETTEKEGGSEDEEDKDKLIELVSYGTSKMPSKRIGKNKNQVGISNYKKAYDQFPENQIISQIMGSQTTSNLLPAQNAEQQHLRFKLQQSQMVMASAQNQNQAQSLFDDYAKHGEHGGLVRDLQNLQELKEKTQNSLVAKRINGEDWQWEREQAFKDWARTENEARDALKRLEMDKFPENQFEISPKEELQKLLQKNLSKLEEDSDIPEELQQLKSAAEELKSAAAQLKKVPDKILYLGVAISIFSQLTGVPIIGLKQCSIYQAPDKQLLQGSLSWQGTRPDKCYFDGKSWGLNNTLLASRDSVYKFEQTPSATLVKNGFVEVDDKANPDTSSKVYQLVTSGGSQQWIGWTLTPSPANGKWFRMNAWIKFYNAVPTYTAGSGDLGFLIQGQLFKDWLLNFPLDEWRYITVIAPVNPQGDGDNIKLVFDQTNADIIVRVSGLELEVFSDKPPAKNSFGLDDSMPFESPEGDYTNLCSKKKEVESYTGFAAAIVSQPIIQRFQKKSIIITTYIVIALSHQISQICVWKNAYQLGSYVFMIAFAASVIQDTIIIAWVTDNIPTGWRGTVLQINIGFFIGFRYIFEAFEKEQEYLAVTAESGGCGQFFEHRGLTQKASIVFLEILKWLNFLAALIMHYFYSDEKEIANSDEQDSEETDSDDDYLIEDDKINKEQDALKMLMEKPRNINEMALAKWEELKSYNFLLATLNLRQVSYFWHFQRPELSGALSFSFAHIHFLIFHLHRYFFNLDLNYFLVLFILYSLMFQFCFLL